MIKRSVFNLTHDRLSTFDGGKLVPAMCEMLAPGDMWRQNTSALVRTQPLLAPVMHKVNVTVHHWFVPLRLLMVQEDWENFITGGLDGAASVTLPTITVNTGTGYAIGSLADHLGLPTGVDDITVSAFPFRAYGEIYNNWYADEQLNTPVVVSKAAGVDTTTNTTLLSACWEKDYFTKARPEPQLGAAVTIPLTGNAPVTGFAVSGANTQTGGNTFDSDGNTVPTGTWGFLTNWVAVDKIQSTGTAGAAGHFPDLEADLSGVSAVNINDLREASAIQRFLEKTNRSGARYTEWLRSFFGVNPQDSRLQLPEYLGGGNVTIQFSEVLQTAEGTDPVGELKGHGIAAGRSNRFKYMAQEHGIVMTLICIRPKTMYSQGIRRPWLYTSKYDFLNPIFANLGDQEVYDQEIYAQASNPTTVFGYTPRYEEYRYIPNTIAGEFRSTLSFWHFARNFSSLPALNASFVTADPTDDPFATSADQFQCRFIHNIKAKRPLPKTANPRLM